jgi:hypothetical protein
MTYEQITFNEFMRRVARPIPVIDTPETRAAIQKARDDLHDTSMLEAMQSACDATVTWEDQYHASYDLEELQKEFEKRLYKNTPDHSGE